MTKDDGGVYADDVPEDEDVPEGGGDEGGGDEDVQADVYDEDLQGEGDEEDGTPALHFIDEEDGTPALHFIDEEDGTPALHFIDEEDGTPALHFIDEEDGTPALHFIDEEDGTPALHFIDEEDGTPALHFIDEEDGTPALHFIDEEDGTPALHFIDEEDGTPALHFIDEEDGTPALHFIVQGEQRADGNVVLSCLEAALHALRQRFPHIAKIIMQSDNAKNLAGKQTKLLLPHVCSAAGLKLVAYYHNEAQSDKDVCNTHLSHQQTQVDAYLVQGDGGRKVSTPKQLAVALMTTSVCNTTVKPDLSAAYRTAVIPAVPGISEFYVAQYITPDGKQEIQLFRSLGQNVPSVAVPIPSCHACSLSTPMGSDDINCTGVWIVRVKAHVCKQGKIDVGTPREVRT